MNMFEEIEKKEKDKTRKKVLKELEQGKWQNHPNKIVTERRKAFLVELGISPDLIK